jgi:hypothetical protein
MGTAAGQQQQQHSHCTNRHMHPLPPLGSTDLAAGLQLSFQGPDVTPAAAQALVDTLAGYPSVKNLSFWGCPIGDEVLPASTLCLINNALPSSMAASSCRAPSFAAASKFVHWWCQSCCLLLLLLLLLLRCMSAQPTTSLLGLSGSGHNNAAPSYLPSQLAKVTELLMACLRACVQGLVRIAKLLRGAGQPRWPGSKILWLEVTAAGTRAAPEQWSVGGICGPRSKQRTCS